MVLADRAADVVGEGADIGRGPLPVVDDEVSVLLRNNGPADPEPLEPSESTSRPAESPGGFRKTLPADGMPSGWCSRRQARMSSSLARISAGSAGRSRNTAAITISAGPAEPAAGPAAWSLKRLCRYEKPRSAAGRSRSVPSASRTIADSSTPAVSLPCAPALAQTAPPTVPGIARPYSSPVRPACCVSVAARAIGTPASA